MDEPHRGARGLWAGAGNYVIFMQQAIAPGYRPRDAIGADPAGPWPNRALWPHLRKAYEHQFLNRIVRIRHRLGWPTPEPPAKRSYRASDAALFLGVSTKSVLRWTATGFLRCERAGDRAHRYYAHEELLRVQHRLKT